MRGRGISEAVARGLHSAEGVSALTTIVMFGLREWQTIDRRATTKAMRRPRMKPVLGMEASATISLSDLPESQVQQVLAAIVQQAQRYGIPVETRGRRRDALSPIRAESSPAMRRGCGRSVRSMSADDATKTTATTEGDRPPFDDHDFGGDVEHHETPDHVEPYASREQSVPQTSPVTMPDHVEPYSSRD